MRKIPDSLADLQQKKRDHTVSLVREAIQDMQAEGCLISVKLLCERTGLSRSVFSKPHVKVVVGEAMSSQCLASSIPEESVGRQYAKAISQLEKFRRRETELKSTNIQLRETIQDLRSECELLRGKLHSLMQQHEMLRRERGEMR